MTAANAAIDAAVRSDGFSSMRQVILRRRFLEQLTAAGAAHMLSLLEKAERDGLEVPAWSELEQAAFNGVTRLP